MNNPEIARNIKLWLDRLTQSCVNFSTLYKQVNYVTFSALELPIVLCKNNKPNYSSKILNFFICKQSLISTAEPDGSTAFEVLRWVRTNE